jgi:hypothetical protein
VLRLGDESLMREQEKTVGLVDFIEEEETAERERKRRKYHDFPLIREAVPDSRKEKRPIHLQALGTGIHSQELPIRWHRIPSDLLMF